VEWGGGLYASKLVERLTEYYSEDGREVALRQLSLPAGQRASIEDALERFVHRLFESGYGQNTTVPLSEAVRAARKQVVRSVDFYAYSRRGAPSAVHTDDLTRLFCSKTVAVCYKAAGLLAPSRDASLFLPKHFAAGHDRFLGLQSGSALGQELPLSFESPLLRGPIAALLYEVGAVGWASRLEERAARVVQRYARRWRAVRESARRRAARRAIWDALVRCLCGGDALGAEHSDSSQLTGSERRALCAFVREASEGKRPRALAFGEYGNEGVGVGSR